MKIIGGLDIGTTGCKISLYDENSDILETYYAEYDVVRQSGGHEIDFGTVKKKVMHLLKKAVEKYEITVLGVTSFGETFVMLDGDDNILAPSILYTDPRGAEECLSLCEGLGEDKLTLLTGVKPHCMYSIYKMIWHKNNTPELFEKCKKILLCEDFIIYCLTGVRRISYSLAARTGAFDIEKKCWIKEIFDTARINVDLMSTPVREGSVCGKITNKLKNELGIAYDIAIVSAGHDQVANMVGSGIFEKTQAMDGTGTVECIPVILQNKPTDISFYQGGYAVVPYLDDEYACYAFSFTGGATLKWFRDNFAEAEYEKAVSEGKNVFAQLDERVGDKPTEILILPHFAGAATPYMDNYAKAAFVGITLETDKFDLYKALMEGTSYEMRINFNIIKKYVADIKEIRTTGGGASSDVWLQIKADILQNEIVALNCREVGAAGSAAMAGHAVGVYKNIKEATAKMAPVRKVFYPNERNSLIYTECYKKYENLYKAIKNL